MVQKRSGHGIGSPMSRWINAIAAIVLVIVCCGQCSGFVINDKTGLLDKIDAVMLTTGKDTRVFVKSITSALIHLVDVDKFYIISPHINDLKKNLGQEMKDPRVILIDERIFPFNGSHVDDVMIQAVRDKGVYPLSGSSQFEKTVWGRIGWFLQQLLKFYAGKVCKLKDFVLLDSDLIWFTDVKFISSNRTGLDGKNSSYNGNRYLYASSNQYHPAYLATLPRIAGVPLVDDGKVFRSGIVHHIVIVESVLEDLMQKTEQKHGLPFWQVLLNQSAVEMTCKAPREGICGGGSTLSEYELYFNFARHEHPHTVELRDPALLWANGPAPGLLFWPNIDNTDHKLSSDCARSAWLGHRQNEVMRVLDKQILADQAQGYDFVGYHTYAKRRYFEVVGEDLVKRCAGVPDPLNTTCSWRGLDEEPETINPSKLKNWFQNCGCYMAMHPSGP